MKTLVQAQNLVAIPEALASRLGIRPGTQLDWQEAAQGDALMVRVLPDYASLAASLLGAGRSHLKPGADPIGDLIRERSEEDTSLSQSL